MNHDELNTRVLALLGDQIGVEVEDIELTDELANDLHMSTGDIADFIEKLKDKEVVEDLELSKNETVEEVLEKIASVSII